jgi:hypothetical protein
MEDIIVTFYDWNFKHVMDVKTDKNSLASSRQLRMDFSRLYNSATAIALIRYTDVATDQLHIWEEAQSVSVACLLYITVEP